MRAGRAACHPVDRLAVDLQQHRDVLGRQWVLNDLVDGAHHGSS
jgi:hypothetical protein